MSITNHSLAVFLINDKVRAVRGCYEIEENATPKNYAIFKTLDDSIKKDDMIVVPTGTRHGMTVVKVTEELTFDPDWHEQIKWVIGKVDSDGYNHLVEMEANAIRQIKEAEATHRRKELAEKMFEHVNMKELAFNQGVQATPPVKAALPRSTEEPNT